MKYLKWMFIVAIGLFLALPAAAQQPGAQFGAKLKDHVSAMDVDKDGKISKDEYMAKCVGGDCAGKFDAMDADKDGFVTKEDIQNAAAKAKDRIAAMDADKDGKISKDEYMAKCAGGDCAGKFDMLDTDKDGFVTKEELQETAAQAREKGKAAGAQMKERLQNKMGTKQGSQ